MLRNRLFISLTFKNRHSETTRVFKDFLLIQWKINKISSILTGETHLKIRLITSTAFENTRGKVTRIFKKVFMILVKD